MKFPSKYSVLANRAYSSPGAVFRTASQRKTNCFRKISGSLKKTPIHYQIKRFSTNNATSRKTAPIPLSNHILATNLQNSTQNT